MISVQPTQFKSEIEALQYDTLIKEVFGDNVKLTYTFDEYVDYTPTPREAGLRSKFDVSILWYTKFLVDQNPTRIVDIGCGGNLLKTVIQRIYQIPVHGMDSDPSSLWRDEFCFFDTQFSTVHANEYESVMSINAIHNVPLGDIGKRVMEFHNIVAPNGYGLLTLDVLRMVEISRKENPNWFVATFNTDAPTPTMIQNYVSDELNKLAIDFIVRDLCIEEHLDEYLNGNIRLIFKK